MSSFVSGKLSPCPLFSCTSKDVPSFLTSLEVARFPSSDLSPLPLGDFAFSASDDLSAVLRLIMGVRHILRAVRCDSAVPRQPLTSDYRLAQRVLSREFLPFFLPVGNNFTKWALNFLPVGKHDLHLSDFQLTDRDFTPARHGVKNVETPEVRTAFKPGRRNQPPDVWVPRRRVLPPGGTPNQPRSIGSLALTY